jgi:hypothetical protein
VHARFRPEASVDGTYEIRFVGGETISLTVAGGELVAMKLPAADPTLVVEAPPEELHEVISGTRSVQAALDEGRVRLLAGTAKELGDLVAMFEPYPDAAQEPPAPHGAVAA